MAPLSWIQTTEDVHNTQILESSPWLTPLAAFCLGASGGYALQVGQARRLPKFVQTTFVLPAGFGILGAIFMRRYMLRQKVTFHRSPPDLSSPVEMAYRT